jgi:membrane protein required for colicin V production
MNLLDFILLIPLVWLCIRGFQKGLIIELASLIGLVLGIIAAYYFATDVQGFLKHYFSFKEQTSRIIAYVAIFLTVMIIVWLIGKMMEGLIDIVAMGWLNKLLGAMIGLAKGIVLVCLILYIFEKTDTREKVITPQVKEGSVFYQPFMQLVNFIVPKDGH